MRQKLIIQLGVRNHGQQVFAWILAAIGHHARAIGEHLLNDLFKAEREERLAQKCPPWVRHELRCHFQIVHPVDDLLAILFIDPKHLAERVKRQLIGEEFHKLNFRPVRFKIIQKQLNLLTDLLTQNFDIGRDEEILLLDPHLHMLRLVHADQIVHRGADEDFRLPMLTGWNS